MALQLVTTTTPPSNLGSDREKQVTSTDTELRMKLNDKEMELIELRHQQLQLLNASKGARENLESALLAKEGAVKELEDALLTREQGLEKSVLRNQELDQLNKKAAAELREAYSKIKRLDKAVGEGKNRIKCMEELAKIHEADLAKCQGERQKLIADAEKLRMDHREEMDALKHSTSNEVQMGNRKSAHLESEIERLRHENVELIESVRSREIELRGVSTGSQDIQRQLIQLRDRLVLWTGGDIHSGSGVSSVLDSRKSWSSTVDGGKLHGPQEMMKEIQKEVEKLHAKALKRETLARKYKDGCRAYKSRLEEFEAKSNSSKSTMESLKSEIKRLKGELLASEDKLKDTQDSLKEGLDRDLKEANAKIKDLVAQLTRKDRSLQSSALEVEAAGQKLTDMENRIIHAEKRAEHSEVRNQQLGDRVLEAEQHLRESIAENEELDARLRRTEGELMDTKRRARIAEERREEVERHTEDFSRRATTAERRCEDLLRKLEDCSKRGEKSDRDLANSERRVAEAEEALSEASRKTKQAENRAANNEWRATEAENWLSEFERRAKDAESRANDLEQKFRHTEGRCKSAESRALEAERQSVEAEGRVSGLERKLREAEKSLEEVKQHWKDAERAKDETEGIVRTAEAAMKKVRVESETELNQVRTVSDMRRKQELQEMQDLKLEVQKLKLAKARSDNRVDELNSVMKQRQSAWATLHQQVGEEGVKQGAMEQRIQGLEDMLVIREKTMSQLKAALADGQNQHLQDIARLKSEIRNKETEIIERDKRLQDLEVLVRRMAARTEGNLGQSF
ncbi:hypothetical protein BSKO_04645 [Bryopsis sp. KO-2023]|nr:hypothetical protein BSKO_04645 [Bryopsis sp. KO-2023]